MRFLQCCYPNIAKRSLQYMGKSRYSHIRPQNTRRKSFPTAALFSPPKFGVFARNIPRFESRNAEVCRAILVRRHRKKRFTFCNIRFTI